MRKAIREEEEIIEKMENVFSWIYVNEGERIGIYKQTS
jgi:hypothetical protein